MKSFDETYADGDFQQQLDRARTAWMTRVPRPEQPDLDVDGLHGSLFARVIAALTGRR
jgi:hypothetical protein